MLGILKRISIVVERTPIVAIRKAILIIRKAIIVQRISYRYVDPETQTQLVPVDDLKLVGGSKGVLLIAKYGRFLTPEEKHLEKQKAMMEKLNKFREDNFLLTPKEQEIFEIAKYYNYKCRKTMVTAGWKCLGKGKKFREHRNWIHLTRIHEVCKENKWDYRIYLDAQFDRAKYWNHKDSKGYPYLNQCYSEGAKEYYKYYVKDYQERYSPTGDAKVKTSIPKSYVDEIAESIVKDCDRFLDWKKRYKRCPAFKECSDAEMKMFWITHNFSISQYYWASLEWGLRYLKSFTDSNILKIAEEVEKLQKSKAIMSVIYTVVKEVEKALNIPSEAVAYE